MLNAITLTELLDSRDARRDLQQRLLREHPEETLVCLTVVMPGSEKRNATSLLVAHAAVEALRETFADSLTQLTERDLKTGYEAYLLCRKPTIEAKRMTCEIEEQHPLGRLFDMDVLHADGRPVERWEVGKPPRTCLLCDNEARFCMRNHTHTQEELLQHIQDMTEAYVREHV